MIWAKLPEKEEEGEHQEEKEHEDMVLIRES